MRTPTTKSNHTQEMMLHDAAHALTITSFVVGLSFSSPRLANAERQGLRRVNSNPTGDDDCPVITTANDCTMFWLDALQTPVAGQPPPTISSPFGTTVRETFPNGAVQRNCKGNIPFGTFNADGTGFYAPTAGVCAFPGIGPLICPNGPNGIIELDFARTGVLCGGSSSDWFATVNGATGDFDLTCNFGNVPQDVDPSCDNNDNSGPQSGGDPHFQRWTQKKRDSFHGECDLVLLQHHHPQQQGDEQKDDGMNVDIHIRTTIRDDIYSFIESSAMKIGHDVIEFHEGGTVQLNNHLLQEDEFPVNLVNGEQITKEAYNPSNGHGRKFTFYVGINQETRVKVKSTKHFMTVAIDGSGKGLERSVGMLGEYGTGNMLARDGTTIMQDFVDFGMEWQVRPQEDMQLFHEARNPQFPYAQCRMPSETVQASRRRKLRATNNGRFYIAAENACTKHQPDHYELCLDDVLLTGDLDLAEAW